MSAPVVSIIGWSGVGKTTFLEKLIPVLKGRGLRIALVKHDGHDFQMDTEGKDTWRFTRAGADVVGISNDRHGALLENRPLSFSELLLKIVGVDLILAEGFDDEALPQIEIHRAGFPQLRCKTPERLLAVVSDEPLNLVMPVFAFDELEAVADLIFPMSDREINCRRALNTLPAEAAGSSEVTITVGGQPLPALDFVQDLFRQVNLGLLRTLRDVPGQGDICIQIRRGAQQSS